MTEARPDLSQVLASVTEVTVKTRPSEPRYTLALPEYGETVTVTQAELFSPTQLQRCVALAVGTVPVNDYTEADGKMSATRALEDDLDAYVFPLIDRGDE